MKNTIKIYIKIENRSKVFNTKKDRSQAVTSPTHTIQRIPLLTRVLLLYIHQ
jgi:hypothetical protein